MHLGMPWFNQGKNKQTKEQMNSVKQPLKIAGIETKIIVLFAGLVPLFWVLVPLLTHATQYIFFGYALYIIKELLVRTYLKGKAKKRIQENKTNNWA